MSDTVPGKHFFQQRNRNRLYEIVVRVVEDAARLDHIRKRDIAQKIGSDPSQISRWLSGPSNWTIDSISDILWALGGEFDYNFVKFEDRPRPNRSHSLNRPAVVELSPSTSSSFSADPALQKSATTNVIQNTAVVSLIRE